MDVVQPHRALLINEILQQPRKWEGTSVRTFGKYVEVLKRVRTIAAQNAQENPWWTHRLVSHDVVKNVATLQHQNMKLRVNVAMLGDDFPFKIDALFQFIGDIQRDEVCMHYSIR
jgi:hypothetical protein